MERQQTINERLLELVRDYGGPSKMAEDLGMSTPQIFYNLKNRPGSKPNSDTIEKVFSLIPNANANWLYKGVGNKYLTEKASQEAPKESILLHDQSLIEAENMQLRLENEFLKQQRDQLVSEKDNYWKLLELMHAK